MPLSGQRTLPGARATCCRNCPGVRIWKARSAERTLLVRKCFLSRVSKYSQRLLVHRPKRGRLLDQSLTRSGVLLLLRPSRQSQVQAQPSPDRSAEPLRSQTSSLYCCRLQGELAERPLPCRFSPRKPLELGRSRRWGNERRLPERLHRKRLLPFSSAMASPRSYLRPGACVPSQRSQNRSCLPARRTLSPRPCTRGDSLVRRCGPV